MLNSRRRLAVAVVVGLVCALGFSGAALAAGSLTPQLRSPGANTAVHEGHVKLVVYVPDPANVIDGNVFLTVSDKRAIKKGLLQTPKHCGFHCWIATMKRVPHSAHLYYSVDKFHFPGNWQDTPGRYYWQAFYYPKNGVVFGVLATGIKSFRIVP